MIRLIKDSKHSIKLEFNSSGAVELSTALQDALHTKEHTVEVGEGSNISSPNKPVRYLMFAVCNELNLLSVTSDKVCIEIDEDEIDYGVERLKECVAGKDFIPSEFCEVSYNNNTLTIYASLVK